MIQELLEKIQKETGYDCILMPYNLGEIVESRKLYLMVNKIEKVGVLKYSLKCELVMAFGMPYDNELLVKMLDFNLTNQKSYAILKRLENGFLGLSTEFECQYNMKKPSIFTVKDVQLHL